MNIYEVVAEGRAAALEIMTDTVVVSRRSSTPVTDPERIRSITRLNLSMRGLDGCRLVTSRAKTSRMLALR